MPFAPRSRPSFPGDDWGELRDAQVAETPRVLGELAGAIVSIYRHSATVMGRDDDPLLATLDADPYFDAHRLYVAAAHLAAYWRDLCGHLTPTLPGIVDLSPLIHDWQRWLVTEPHYWHLRRPDILRRFIALIAASRRGADVSALEILLWEALQTYYPVPPRPWVRLPFAHYGYPETDRSTTEAILPNDEELPRPAFPGDNWAELRREQHCWRYETMEMVVGHVARSYRRCATVLAAERDPVAMRLTTMGPLPLRVVMLAHWHLAGFWRLANGYAEPDPDLYEPSLSDRSWRKWIMEESTLWVVEHPTLVRRFAILVASAGTPDAVATEHELMRELGRVYPLPPTDHDDLLDRLFDGE